MDTISEKDRLDYYWKNFALIADQRVKTFNFYIIVVLATFAATVGALRPTTPRLSFTLMGLGHMFVVIVFWMIEARGKAILRITKIALREFEGSPAFGEGYKPIAEENKSGPKGPFDLVTYGNAFRLVFLAHFLFGFVIAAFPHRIVP